jgi:predicted SpoU family rRNA methylase
VIEASVGCDTEMLVKSSLMRRKEGFGGRYGGEAFSRSREFEDVIEEFSREKGESIHLTENYEISSVDATGLKALYSPSEFPS